MGAVVPANVPSLAFLPCTRELMGIVGFLPPTSPPGNGLAVGSQGPAGFEREGSFLSVLLKGPGLHGAWAPEAETIALHSPVPVWTLPQTKAVSLPCQRCLSTTGSASWLAPSLSCAGLCGSLRAAWSQHSSSSFAIKPLCDFRHMTAFLGPLFLFLPRPHGCCLRPLGL